ncbi:MAG: hypothetical protein Kow0056_12600 [Coriobacteriia bacterium]
MPRRAVIMSDTHLGTTRSDSRAVNSFLRSLEAEASRLRLILAGDIVDLWRADDTEVVASCPEFFDAVRGLADSGAIIDWVIGNHDHHLLRALQGDGSPVLDALPRSIRFHRPFRRLVHHGRVFVITHGDVYDFFWLPLQGLPPLSWVLEPADVEEFYDWVYLLDKGLVRSFDRYGTRGLLLAWVSQRWRDLWGWMSARADESSSFDEETLESRAAAARSMSEALSFDPVSLARALARLELETIWERTDDALRWRRMRYYSPFPSRVGRRRFAGRHEVVTGHFHDPRQGTGAGWRVTDCGSWWEGPGKGGTYVEVVDGVARLRRYPGG